MEGHDLQLLTTSPRRSCLKRARMCAERAESEGASGAHARSRGAGVPGTPVKEPSPTELLTAQSGRAPTTRRIKKEV